MAPRKPTVRVDHKRERILAHDWPFPEKYSPGVEYLWVPLSMASEGGVELGYTVFEKHKREGWVFQGLEHAFESVPYMLMMKGTPHEFVRRHQLPPNVAVWEEDGDELAVNGSVIHARGDADEATEIG